MVLEWVYFLMGFILCLFFISALTRQSQQYRYLEKSFYDRMLGELDKQRIAEQARKDYLEYVLQQADRDFGAWLKEEGLTNFQLWYFKRLLTQEKGAADAKQSKRA